MANRTSSEAFTNIISTSIATASTTTGYSYRPRTALNPPNPYPPASSPPRHRSKKSHKPTPTAPTPRNRISKPTTPSLNMTAEQKAAIRALRHETRQCAKMTPYVPKPRTKTKKTKVSKPAQVLTFTEERVKTVANDGGWVAKGYRCYTSLVGFSVFTPDIQERVS